MLLLTPSSISSIFLCSIDSLKINSTCFIKQPNLALVPSTFTPLIDISDNWEFPFLPIKLYNYQKTRRPGLILLNFLWKIFACSSLNLFFLNNYPNQSDLCWKSNISRTVPIQRPMKNSLKLTLPQIFQFKFFSIVKYNKFPIKALNSLRMGFRCIINNGGINTILYLTT